MNVRIAVLFLGSADTLAARSNVSRYARPGVYNEAKRSDFCLPWPRTTLVVVRIVDR